MRRSVNEAGRLVGQRPKAVTPPGRRLTWRQVAGERACAEDWRGVGAGGPGRALAGPTGGAPGIARAEEREGAAAAR
eukprot:12250990-Alexandrium_andersonii.AAC.1